MQLDTMVSRVVLRSALEEYVDTQHRLARTARTGGHLPIQDNPTPEERERFAQGCDRRRGEAVQLLAQLDELEELAA